MRRHIAYSQNEHEEIITGPCCLDMSGVILCDVIIGSMNQFWRHKQDAIVQEITENYVTSFPIFDAGNAVPGVQKLASRLCELREFVSRNSLVLYLSMMVCEGFDIVHLVRGEFQKQVCAFLRVHMSSDSPDRNSVGTVAYHFCLEAGSVQKVSGVTQIGQKRRSKFWVGAVGTVGLLHKPFRTI